MEGFFWIEPRRLQSKSYRCGYCDNLVASDRGYTTAAEGLPTRIEPNGYIFGAVLYVCHHCNNPTYFREWTQIPSPKFGNPVLHVPKDVTALYNEARQCFSVGAYTSIVMCCRKLLMHIAVDRGAPTGKTFAEYVTFLESKHYIPPNGTEWADLIRKRGNEANHEIVIIDEPDAKVLVTFVEMLLKFIYEFPAAAKPTQQLPANQ
jgi:hypothetical protein